MRQRTIDLGKITAMSVLAAGLAFCSTHAKAEEAGEQVAAVEMPKPRAAVPVMSAGGVKGGQVMVIGGGAPEVMSAAALAQRPVVTPVKAAELCVVK